MHLKVPSGFCLALKVLIEGSGSNSQLRDELISTQINVAEPALTAEDKRYRMASCLRYLMDIVIMDYYLDIVL